MIKPFIRGLILILVFAGTWTLFRQVDLVGLFRVKKISDKTEKKLGELYWNIFKNSGKECGDTIVLRCTDSILDKICRSNDIAREKIKVHILIKDEINAFALPDGHLVIFSGLIRFCEKEEELDGVICHELGHINLNHVMKKLAKEVGFSVLASMTSGGAGTETTKEAVKLLTSTAYDRELESEADFAAVDFMLKAGINPSSFPDFLYRISLEELSFLSSLSWISTHPESRERAESIVKYILNKGGQDHKGVLTPAGWNAMKSALSAIADE